jgi:hypothetical protein
MRKVVGFEGESIDKRRTVFELIKRPQNAETWS